MRQLISAELDFIKVAPSPSHACAGRYTRERAKKRQWERARRRGNVCEREAGAMGESETQGQCVCEREAGAMRERETEGQCVRDV